MTEDFQSELQELGLLPAEAQVYLALLRNGALGGSAIASVTGFPRSSVYLTLNSLLDKGLVEGGAGHGSRFSVVPPEKALPSLVVQERESLAQRENLAGRLGQKLSSLAEPVEAVPDELVQVIRSPRGVLERFERLQLESQRQIDVLNKAPFYGRERNPTEKKVLERGVKCRGLYERTVLDAPEIKPYLAQWIADGEEVRIYDGVFPHKLAIFDRQRALVLVNLPGDQMRTVFIGHPELAKTLAIAFDALWERSEPLASPDKAKTQKPAKPAGPKKASEEKALPRLGSNSHRHRSSIIGKAETT